MKTKNKKTKKMEIKESVLDLVGNTPMIKLEKNLFAKIEKFDPGGSVKDRIAIRMIECAEKRKELTRDKVIIEPTSGNTGIGIAMAAAVKGYKAVIVMPESVSIERRKIIHAFGAEIILTLAEKGTDGAIELVKKMTAENPDKYFFPNQFSNNCNVLAHYFGTGEEILRQTNGKIDIFVAGVGTGGTLMGVSKRLKEFNPKIKIIGVEPEFGHKIQGLKNMKESKVPKIFERSKIDKTVMISDEEAYETARMIARKYGLLVGMSSGAAAYVAFGIAKENPRKKVVVFLPDGGERYLSTSLFGLPEDKENK